MNNSPKILLFGGTTEGKASANWLSDMGFSFYYSTKTKSSFKLPDGCVKLEGALAVDEMCVFCAANNIQLIIDAAHPYASDLHKNIAACAQKTSLPSIRVERTFTDAMDSPLLIYIDSLEQMVEYIHQQNYQRTLSLMGVKSVPFLHQYLMSSSAWYRILDRPASWNLALSCGVDKKKIIASSAFENIDDVNALITQHSIDVLLTKDSGFNGLFHHKVELVEKHQIPLLVLKRPVLPEYNHIVKGRADFKSAIQNYLNLPRTELAHGFTSGTCAAICAKAACEGVLSGTLPTEEFIHLPDGERVIMQIHTSGIESESAFATVIKNSGDDPDLMDGMVIGCRVRRNSSDGIRFVQGEGVGTVRLPGLGLPIGEPAINSTPRKMIIHEIEMLCNDYDIQSGFDVSVFIPGGKQLAEKTFNPRLGIEGGLSIIGSTGRIKPFSSEAYIATIIKQIGVACDNNELHVVMNSGGRSERYLKTHFCKLSDLSFIQYGNYIGDALNAASKTKINRVSMGIMTGKAVKLAEGNLDTHSRNVVMNKTFIAEIAKACAYPKVIVDKVMDITMARELESIFEFSLEEPFFKMLKEKCESVCHNVVNGFDLEIILISNEGKMLF